MIKLILATALMLTAVAIVRAQSNGPLVYPNWPPSLKSTVSGKPSSMSAGRHHQLVYQLRSGGGGSAPSSRYQLAVSPSNMFFSHKRPPMTATRLMRPTLHMKTMPSLPHHFFGGQKNQLINKHPVHYYKKPASSSASASPPSSSSSINHVTKVSFHSSAAGPNSGEYVFENPFFSTSTTASSAAAAAPSIVVHKTMRK